MAGGPAGRVLVTSAGAAAVPTGMRILPLGPFSHREAISYLTERLAADPDKRHGVIELTQDLDSEPVALAQASALIANTPVSCREYRAHFVRRREQLAESSSARPSAAAVTWTFSLGRAEQLAGRGPVAAGPGRPAGRARHSRNHPHDCLRQAISWRAAVTYRPAARAPARWRRWSRPAC